MAVLRSELPLGGAMKSAVAFVLLAVAVSCGRGFGLPPPPSPKEPPPVPVIPRPDGVKVIPAQAFGGQVVRVEAQHLDADAGETPQVTLGGFPVRVFNLKVEAGGTGAVSAEVPATLTAGQRYELIVRTSGGEAKAQGFLYLGTGHLAGDGEAARIRLPVNLGRLAARKVLLAIEPKLRRLVVIDPERPDAPKRFLSFFAPDPADSKKRTRVTPIDVAFVSASRAVVSYIEEPPVPGGTDGRADSGIFVVEDCPKPGWRVTRHSRLLSDYAGTLGRLVHSPSSKAIFGVFNGSFREPGAALPKDGIGAVKFADGGSVEPACKIPETDLLSAAKDFGQSGHFFSTPATGQPPALSISANETEGLLAIGRADRVEVFDKQSGVLKATIKHTGTAGADAERLTDIAFVRVQDSARPSRLVAVEAALGQLLIARSDGTLGAVSVPRGAVSVLGDEAGRALIPVGSGLTVVDVLSEKVVARIPASRPLLDATICKTPRIPGRTFVCASTPFDPELPAAVAVIDVDGLAENESERERMKIDFDVSAFAQAEAFGGAIVLSKGLGAVALAQFDLGGLLPLDKLDATVRGLHGLAVNGRKVAMVLGKDAVVLDIGMDNSVSVSTAQPEVPIRNVVSYKEGFLLLQDDGFLEAGMSECPLATASGPKNPPESCYRKFQGLTLTVEKDGSPSMLNAFAVSQASGTLFVAQRSPGTSGPSTLVAAAVSPAGAVLARMVVPGSRTPDVLAASHDGRVFAVLTNSDKDEKKAMVHFALDGRLASPVEIPLRENVRSIAVAPDGTAIYLGTARGRIMAANPHVPFRPSDLRLLITVGGRQEDVRGLCPTSDGAAMAALLHTSPPSIVLLK